MEALAWIGQAIEWFGRFIPRWVILNTTEGAIKFVAGSRVRVCGPGIWWYWPARTEFVSYPTARQTDRLTTQTICTADDRTIIVGGLLVYKIEALDQLLPVMHNAEAAMRDIALTAVHDVCCGMNWDELKGEQRKGTLDTKLKNAAQKQLTEYGVRVVKLMLTDLAPCRVLKISQTVAKEDDNA